MALFDPIQIKDIAFRNRIGVSPMCQYSASDGHPNDWHLVHLGSRAVGGAGMVMVEATGVEARGRISPGDAGIYHDSHVESWKPIAAFIQGQGAVAAMQLAHAGRKASTDIPWKTGKPVGPEQGGWTPIVAPSALAFDAGYQTPQELSVDEIKKITQAFVQAAQRALNAGFQMIEIHSAHGYLLHEFLSPLSNKRTDNYGGSFENRTRFIKEVVQAVRKVWPERLPLWTRISASDWLPEAWDIEQSVELSRLLKTWGVDVIDVSSGGNAPKAPIPNVPGYQVPFSERIKKDSGILTAAVGLITEAQQAETILSSHQADFVLLAREMLRDPYWPRRAAKELGIKIQAPPQYLRSW